jgi:hypothetical protein
MLKFGVLGAGHLGKYIYVYYNNLKNMNWFMIQIKRMPIKFLNLDTNILVQLPLIHAVDVIDIVTQLFPITNVQSCHQIRQTRFIETHFKHH